MHLASVVHIASVVHTLPVVHSASRSPGASAAGLDAERMKARRFAAALGFALALASAPSAAAAGSGSTAAADAGSAAVPATTGSGSVTGSRSMADTSGATTGFVLPLPLPPDIVTPFRRPAEKWLSGHRGVDLATTAGSQVRAAGAGVVAFAGRLVDRNLVSVKHSEQLRTTYEPVRPVVVVGQHVAAGQLIGVLETGHPPCAPAVCLHWGARLGADTYLDPMSLLTGWPVRLKPWEGLDPGG